MYQHFPRLVAEDCTRFIYSQAKAKFDNLPSLQSETWNHIRTKWSHRLSSNDLCCRGLLPHTQQTANRWTRATRAVSQKQLHKCLSYAIVSLPWLFISVQVCVCAGLCVCVCVLYGVCVCGGGLCLNHFSQASMRLKYVYILLCVHIVAAQWINWMNNPVGVCAWGYMSE